MRRRQRIHQHFQNDLRYFTPPRPVDPRSGEDIIRLVQQWIRGTVETKKTEDAQKPNDAQNRPQDTVVPPRLPEVSIGVRNRQGDTRFFTLEQIAERAMDFLPTSPGGQVHLDAHSVFLALSQSLESLMADGSPFPALLQADHLPPLAIRIPPGERGQAVLDTIVRLMGPIDLRLQDGLRALMASPQFQQLFQGDKMTQGATTLLPNHELVSVLLPQVLVTGNPELARALLVAQGLPPALINNIPDRALAGVLQSLLQTSQAASKNPLFFLQSIASALTAAGIPVQKIQNLLLAFVQQSQKAGVPGELAGRVTPEGLERWAAKLFAANNPQLLGLNQMVQESFGQGVTKILNAFIRVFFGGALLQSQLTWPQAVPNERLLAELGGLFARRGEPAAGSNKKRRARKKSRRVDEIDATEHPRVERKEDITDEPPLPPQMGSVFIDVDPEEV